jgi:hypothetical protein
VKVICIAGSVLIVEENFVMIVGCVVKQVAVVHVVVAFVDVVAMEAVVGVEVVVECG